jgi:hypothetical protein
LNDRCTPPHSAFYWLRWEVFQTFFLDWAWTMILSITDSLVTRITVMSYCAQLKDEFLKIKV